MDPKKLTFLLLLAITGGVLTAKTKSMLIPAIFHATVNLLTIGTVLAFRPA